MPAASQIDRLIEMGLNRYGAGDLDGALLLWEEALAIDPANPQANSYVDYVRLNYELLANSTEPAIAYDDGFGVEEEPEYHIEIVPGQLQQAVPERPSGEVVDAGWFMDEGGDGATDPGPPPGSEPISLELEAEEPPPPPDINFDDATREYHGLPAKPPAPPATVDFTSEPTQDFQQDEVTGGFRSEGTPVGFSMQETEVRKRDLGFVQPAPEHVSDKPSSPIAIGTASTIEVGQLGDPTAEHNPFASIDLANNDGAPLANGSGEDDLIDSLPTPRPASDFQETQSIPTQQKVTTRDMPEQTRTPARRDSESLSQAEVMLPHARTEDFDQRRMPVDVGAPTRELGLRAQSPAGSMGDDDDVPTKQSDARAIRELASRNEGNARPATEGTRRDIVLQFDPIDARSAQILDEVDDVAPANETKEDMTRRRITSLLQKAVDYHAQREFDKAVTAVDLALSEDPNSALGQKLITRNRDTIMQVFQGFLGDLERMPQLARPLHELASAPISPRAAFLLSRIDGGLTIDEILDVSGMPKLEAYRHLCQLFLRGILR